MRSLFWSYLGTVGFNRSSFWNLQKPRTLRCGWIHSALVSRVWIHCTPFKTMFSFLGKIATIIKEAWKEAKSKAMERITILDWLISGLLITTCGKEKVRWLLKGMTTFTTDNGTRIWSMETAGRFHLVVSTQVPFLETWCMGMALLWIHWQIFTQASFNLIESMGGAAC